MHGPSEFQFSALEGQCLSGQFALAHGTAPSVGTLVVPPQNKLFPAVGTLTITDNVRTIRFEDCLVDKMDGEFSAEQAQTWVLHLYDRRWRWIGLGRLSGFYNTLLPKGRDFEIDPKTAKSPQDLAKLCFDALDEKNYDVSQMPNLLRPVTEWDYTLPTSALARLCDQTNSRVVLGLDGKIRILPAGEGEQLNAEIPAVADSLSYDPPERPDNLVIVTDRMAVQYDFELEPVAEEVDKTIEKLDYVSYAPKEKGRGDKPWDFTNIRDGFHDIKNINTRTAALRSVFKMYRIKLPDVLELGGFSYYEKEGSVKSTEVYFNNDELWRVLPLRQEQNDTYKVGKLERLRPAIVGGIFWPGEDRLDNSISDMKKLDLSVDMSQPINRDEEQPHNGVYYGGFTIDTERGLVIFSEPVIQKVEEKLKEKTIVRTRAAELKIRLAVNIRDRATRGWLRHEFYQKNPGKKLGTQARYISVETIHPTIDANKGTSSAAKNKSNFSEAKSAASRYFEIIEKEYLDKNSRSITYCGFWPIKPDGAIQQVVWMLGEDGYAWTRASRNREEPYFTGVTLQEQRRLQQLAEQLKKSDQPAATQLENALRNQGAKQ